MQPDEGDLILTSGNQACSLAAVPEGGVPDDERCGATSGGLHTKRVWLELDSWAPRFEAGSEGMDGGSDLRSLGACGSSDRTREPSTLT